MENKEKTEQRQRILAKTAELFMRYGIRSITMDEIATQLGISKKTIYQFFTDKDEMVEAVITEEVGKKEAECRNFQTEGVNAVHEIFLAMEEMQEMMSAMNPQMMYDLEKHHAAAFRKLKYYKYQFLHNIIRENLERGISEGLYRKEINIELTTRYRIETAFLSFNTEAFPAHKFSMAQTAREMALLFMYSVCSTAGKKWIEKYLHERQKSAMHES